MNTRRRRVRPAPAVALALVAQLAMAASPNPVRYTEAVERPVRRSVGLPGSVESARSSVVAGEVAGLVVALEAREGDHVREGQPLARLRTTYYELELRAAEGRLKEARARLELAASKLARAAELFRDQIISQDAQDDARSEYTSWQGRLDQSEAEIASLGLALDRCVVRAPFAGVVVRKRAEIGEWIEQGGAVAELVAPTRMEINLDVPERYYDRVRTGTPATATFEALDGLRLSGRVRAIVPRADPQARSFPIKIAIDNPGERVAVGMLARVALPVGEPRGALIVPKDAIVRQGDGEVVFRINDENAVETVAVDREEGVGVWVVVRGALAAGDRVVTRGNERLFPGQAVSGERQDYPLP